MKARKVAHMQGIRVGARVRGPSSISRAWLLALSLASPAGCGTNEEYYSCADPTRDSFDPCGEKRPDAGAEEDAGPDAPACDGQCVPAVPLGFSGPALLWAGPRGTEPMCPETAPSIGYEGHGDLDMAPHDCPACLCDEPSVACEPPVTWTAHSTTCSLGPAGLVTSFDAPDPWDGACSAVNAIAANQLCSGSLCVKSLSIDAPLAVSGACAAHAQGPQPAQDGAWPFQTFARACQGPIRSSCPVPVENCVPEAVAGFETCVFGKGEETCPPDWPVQHVFYEGVDDTRACSDCACGEPSGASCSMTVSAFSDGVCGAQVTSNSIVSGTGICTDVVPGKALGSKSATGMTATPGTCAPSGGMPTGGVAATGPATFCCREVAK